MRYLESVALILFLIPATVSAGVYKLAVPADGQVNFYWWPELPATDGWIHDEHASRQHGANMLVPEGQTFAGAPAVMYGKALYKPRMPGTKSIAQLIADDHRDFANHSPGITIASVAPLKDGDGKILKCFSFVPKGKGSWEWVAYGEEGEFYLVFSVSAQNASALQAALPAFKRMIALYKERL